jgi:hypothetical protein
MQNFQVKTHHDGIWISEQKEKRVVSELCQQLTACGFAPAAQRADINFGHPYIYKRHDQTVNCRLIDSVFMTDSTIWNDPDRIVITDNHAIAAVPGHVISVLPEFWSIWRFDPVYQNGPASKGFNCFMNRPRGDRSIVFYELIKRNLLNQGLVSYNCSKQDYQQEFVQVDLKKYQQQHIQGQEIIPYNTVESHGSLEQCIIDSNVSVILETYNSDSHIVFSEKMFRALQLPRPWLLYCSAGSVALLEAHGFDTLQDFVDTTYDTILDFNDRLMAILDQLETFVNRRYTQRDYDRFHRAAEHNQTLLRKFETRWPKKMLDVFEQIGNV